MYSWFVKNTNIFNVHISVYNPYKLCSLLKGGIVSITKEENEKLVDVISGKEIKDPYGPTPGSIEKNDTKILRAIKHMFERKLTWSDFWKVGFFN